MDEPTLIAPDALDPCPHCGQPVGDAWLVCAWCGSPIAAPAELAVGSTLADGRYQMLGVIGRGGFGITYEAGDTRLKRRVAVKELFPESAVRHGSVVLTPPHARASFREARDRFIREARVLARFTHPGVVRVYEVFEAHGTAYLVMERLSGRTLIDVLRTRGQPFEEREVLDVAARVAAALRPIHAAGVLHRDVNPSNVILTEHGRIVMIDFGLARDFDSAQTMGMTRMVTPGYAPMEQYRGEARFGPTTDIYGLAASCYRLATGRVPVAAVERQAGAELPAPRRLNPAISKQVSDGLLDGLELEPDHRPQDLDAFLARLGVRWLPDSPRSVLLGTVGAQPADLTIGDVTSGLEVESIAGLDTPTAPPPTADATVVPVEADQTWSPGDGRADDATRAASAMGPQGAPPPYQPPYEPPDAEPARVSRGLVTVPLAALAVAAGSAAPLLVVAALVVLVLPVLATVGDGVARRERAERGVAGKRGERMPAGVMVPSQFVRNLVTSVLRASPIVGVGAVFLAVWYGLTQTSLPQVLLDGLLRLIGGGAVAALLLSCRDGSPRFRTGLGIDRLAAWVAPEGRVNERVFVAWLVIAIGVVAALWLSPDAFPLP